jgi:Xaa-Pro aminopeptidase
MQNLSSQLESHTLEALWVTTPANVRYLSGFTSPEDASLLFTPHGSRLITDTRYTLQAEQESKFPSFIFKKRDEIKAELERTLAGKRVGFEKKHMTVAKLEELQSMAGITWVATDGLVEKLRLIKTSAEVALIRAAQNIAQDALEATLPRLQAGVQEREIALELEFQMRRMGAEAAAFEIIVASGLRSAMPHGSASSKRLEEGDLVTIDMGARVQGYHSDMTRAYPIGELRPELVKMYRAVQTAKRLAFQSAQVGMGCKALDAVARDYLATQGYTEEFAHSLGHGVGLEIHEGPGLSSKLETEIFLEAGMIITLEPGVYSAGLGGVRLEDLVWVTETGAENLSTALEVEL